jgi:hypothetical protein
MQQQCLLGVRFGVTRHHQAAAIGGRKRHVQHLNGGEFFQHGSRGQARSVRLQAVLQGHREAVGQKGNQDVRIYPMFELMVDRAKAQIAGLVKLTV